MTFKQWYNPDNDVRIAARINGDKDVIVVVVDRAGTSIVRTSDFNAVANVDSTLSQPCTEFQFMKIFDQALRLLSRV